MIRSMTGFGRAEGSFEGGGLSVEIRTVNGRHCDVRVRAPRELSSLEAQARGHAARHFSRGSIDVSIRWSSPRATQGRVEIDLETAQSYAEAAREIAVRTQLCEPVSAVALLSLPGVARLREPELDEEAVASVLEQCIEQASRETVAMRQREGELLAQELQARSAALAESLAAIEVRADEVRGALRARLEKRLAGLAPEVQVDSGRLEQEVVLYVDRMDVTEETVRFRSHLAQFHETLGLEGPVGRRLEFILQELTRETNTIGSKASDAPMAALVVELKTELEKLREQVLNVE